MTTPPKNAKIAALEALIEAHAIELKLPTVRRRFRALAAEATREQQTPTAYLAALLEAEMAERAERREKRRLIDARFPQIKRLEDFRFQDNPKIPQATIAALAEGSWIDDRESIIFIGDSGTGKTMLATALAVCACHQGRRVRFTTLAGLANELQEAQSRRELGRVPAGPGRDRCRGPEVRRGRVRYRVRRQRQHHLQRGLPVGSADVPHHQLAQRHDRELAGRNSDAELRLGLLGHRQEAERIDRADRRHGRCRLLVDRLQDRLGQRLAERADADLPGVPRRRVGFERPADVHERVDGLRVRSVRGHRRSDRQLDG